MGDLLTRDKATLKESPEDFLVEELPSPEFTSSDSNPDELQELFWVTKRQLSTPQMLREVARHYGISTREIGHCGNKDTQAVTKQQISLPQGLRQKFPVPSFEGLVEWLPVDRLIRPLKLGHSAGNRFRIRLENLDGVELQRRWTQQVPVGFANYFGIQRFGQSEERWREGIEQLKNPPPRKERRIWPQNFAISAAQGYLFNQYLSRRIQLERFQSFLENEPCLNFETKTQHAANGDCYFPAHTPLGPIFGYQLEAAPGVTGFAEQALLKKAGIRCEDFARFRAPGSRRPMRLPLPPLSVDGDCVSFDLPPGVYATVLLEHFLELQLPQSQTEASDH